MVLNGDSERDERLLHATELWQKGYAHKVIISAHKAAWQSDEDFSDFFEFSKTLWSAVKEE